MWVDQVQASKITLKTINNLNSHVFHTAYAQNKIGQAFEVRELAGTKEKFAKEYPWNYKINQYGFRGDDWDFKKSPAFFGCSCTFGVGVETPISEIIQAKYGKGIVPNIGVPGGSAVNIIKTFVAFVKLHSVSHAFITLPSLGRFFYPKLGNNKWEFMNLIPNFNSAPIVPEKVKTRVLQMWLDGSNISYTLDYIDWAEEVAKAHNVKLFWSSWDRDGTEPILCEVVKNNFFKWPDLINYDARDGMHYGQKNHQQVADTCWDIINQTQ